MKKFVKWIFISFGFVIVLLIAAIIVTPMFIDIQSYKPEIEKKVAELTGRPFSLAGEMDFSLFPWAGFSFSDLAIGNPQGFSSQDFVKIKSFEARVKLIPLLSKEIEVKQFILDGPEIYLTRRSDGTVNWQSGGKEHKNNETGPAPAVDQQVQQPSAKRQELPITSLLVGEFAITNGHIFYKDELNSIEKEITDLNLRLTNITLDDPIGIAFEAMIDQHPVSMNGSIGPIGKEPGKGTIALDLTIAALNQLTARVDGQITDLLATPAFNFALELQPFSPKQVMADLGLEFPIETTDQDALEKTALTMNVSGNLQNISVSDGLLTLDDSQLIFSADVREMTKPDISFRLDLDTINIDRYLPAPADTTKATKKGDEKTASISSTEKKPINYEPLRKLILNGDLVIGELIAKGVKMNNFNMKIQAREGLITCDPVNLKLYSGSLATEASLNVQGDTPMTKIDLNAQGIQIGPLLRDALQKDILEGAANAMISIATQGADPDTIKKGLNGTGDLKFIDGAIVGIDIAGMARDLSTTLTGGEKSTVKPKTDFAEFHVPFTLTNGLFNTRNTTLRSPLLRLTASGDANLVTETLKMRVKPKIVGTLKGQGDTTERGGVAVPIVITGTFQQPQFAADTEALVQELIPPKENVIETLADPEKAGKSLEQKGKDILKGFGFGN